MTGSIGPASAMMHQFKVRISFRGLEARLVLPALPAACSLHMARFSTTHEPACAESGTEDLARGLGRRRKGGTWPRIALRGLRGLGLGLGFRV